AVALDHGPGPDARLRRDLAGVGDLDAVALAVPEPAMERAAQRIALDLATHPEVRAEVRAVGVEDPRGAARVAERDELAAEPMQPTHVAGGELVGVAGAEPAVGIGRKRKAIAHADP